MLKHAEGNWLANFTIPNEKGDLRVRNMAWWRSPAMPATALVIGNPKMDDEGWETHIKSLAGALPIMLGDPRKLSPGDLKKYRGYADWLHAMQAQYDFMGYRQDLPGFGEPKEGSLDGFQRINTDSKQGGIIGVFRQGARETKRTVFINYLDPARSYKVKTMEGKVICKATGQELSTKGFEVPIEGLHAGSYLKLVRTKPCCHTPRDKKQNVKCKLSPTFIDCAGRLPARLVRAAADFHPSLAVGTFLGGFFAVRNVAARIG